MGIIKSIIKLAIIFVIVVVYIATVHINTANMKAHYKTNVPTISISELEKGDIIFVRKNTISGLIPGYWSHTAIFEAFDENGTAWAIQSESFSTVERIELEKIINKKLHVMVGKVNTTSSNKATAVEWAETVIDSKFDYFYPSKQLDGDSFYCSELIWVAYRNAGIELDSNPGLTLRYMKGVAPQEIFENALVTVYNLEGY